MISLINRLGSYKNVSFVSVKKGLSISGIFCLQRVVSISPNFGLDELFKKCLLNEVWLAFFLFSKISTKNCLTVYDDEIFYANCCKITLNMISFDDTFNMNLLVHLHKLHKIKLEQAILNCKWTCSYFSVKIAIKYTLCRIYFTFRVSTFLTLTDIQSYSCRVSLSDFFKLLMLPNYVMLFSIKTLRVCCGRCRRSTIRLNK